MAVEQINNREGGLDVRNKLNQTINNGNEVPNLMVKVRTAVPGNVAIFGEDGQVLDSGQTPGGGEASNIPTWESLQNTPIALDFVVRFDSRLYASRVADNLNNQPPVGGGNNTFWREVSPSESTGTPLWAAGVFSNARARVFRIESGVFVEYVLTVADNLLPFESTDLDAEITAGQWQRLGGGDATAIRPLESNVNIANNDAHTVDMSQSNVLRLVIASGANAMSIGVSNIDSDNERTNKRIVDNRNNPTGVTLTFDDQSGAINYNDPDNFNGTFPNMDVPANTWWEIELQNEPGGDVALYINPKRAR